MELKATKLDIAHSIIKGSIGTIPVVGSLASEIFGLIISPPLEKRKAEWMNDIAEKIFNLQENRGVDLNNLKENQIFIDIVLQATSLALKTSEKVKLDSFKNAIINAALGFNSDVTKNQLFLHQLDKFSALHIIILNFIDNPSKWFNDRQKEIPNIMMGSLHGLIIEAYPDLKNQDDILDLIWEDLKTAGFHKSGSLKSMMTINGVLSERTTTLGKEFLSFITTQ